MRVAQFATALLLIAVGAARAQAFDLKWGGLAHDGFSLDGLEVWTGEDGGRIRHRNGTTGAWTFQTVPSSVKDTIRRIHFIDSTHGWAVSAGGQLLKTVNGGTTWTVLWFQTNPFDSSKPEDLWDVVFLSDTEGWILGLHGIWYTNNVGENEEDWELCRIGLPTGVDMEHDVELYSLDIVTNAQAPTVPNLLGLASGEPGLILRATGPLGFDYVPLDFCGQGGIGVPPCMTGYCPDAADGNQMELWDVKISRHTTDALALCVGGTVNSCGIALATFDNGLTWTRENHECQPCVADSTGGCPCSSNSEYSDDAPLPTPPDGETWRLRKFWSLYGVSIFHATNEAIACGYSGQCLLRAARSPTNPAIVWKDRTRDGHQLVAPLCVTYPMFGAVTATNVLTSPSGYITGTGGYILESVNATSGGSVTPWAPITPKGGPYRTKDVYFSDSMNGWVVGQFSRIAKTITGGTTWSEVEPLPDLQAGELNAITFKPGNLFGVCVGEIDNATDMPKILYNTDVSLLTLWDSPDSISGLDTKTPWDLRAVTWTAAGSTSHFWAVGTPGLILHSTDDCVNWNAFVPPGMTPLQLGTFTFEGVAFHDPNNGLFVGTKELGRYAAAYNVTGNNVTWNELNVSSVGANTTFLDVEIFGATAYIVGEDRSLASPLGYLLTSTLSGTTWSALAVVATVPNCAVATDPDILEPILTEVEVDPSGLVWIGGECGRVWSWTSSGGLLEHKTSTDSTVRGMSFYGASAGYITGQRSNRTQQAIVEIH